jgi:hypothetical protein
MGSGARYVRLIGALTGGVLLFGTAAACFAPPRAMPTDVCAAERPPMLRVFV